MNGGALNLAFSCSIIILKGSAEKLQGTHVSLMLTDLESNRLRVLTTCARDKEIKIYFKTTRLCDESCEKFYLNDFSEP